VSNSIVRSQQRWARRLRSSPPVIIDQLGSDIAGHYVKLTLSLSLSLSLSRLRQLTRSDALYFGFSGQTSNKNLDTSEQFYLGGPAGIKRRSRGRLAC
jgi:outer membrane protein assembly factor BamA